MTYYQGTTASTNASTWYAWSSDNCTTTSDTTTTWATWNGTSTAASDSTITVWGNWTSGTTTTGNVTRIAYPQPREQTPEERAAEAARRAQYEKERKEAEAKRLKAEKAAMRLFLGVVGRKAFAAFKKRGYHEVIGHSGKRYRLRQGQRVQEMVENFGEKVAADLCIVVDGAVPAMDALVMQLLLIMSGEEGEKMLHKTANRFARAA